MLQRYNYIRINRVIKKMLPHEETKKNTLKEELKKEDSLLTNYTYTIISKQDKGKNISFQEFLDIATYAQLIQYRTYLSYIKAFNQKLMKQQNFYELGEHSFSFTIQIIKTILINSFTAIFILFQLEFLFLINSSLFNSINKKKKYYNSVSV